MAMRSAYFDVLEDVEGGREEDIPFRKAAEDTPRVMPKRIMVRSQCEATISGNSPTIHLIPRYDINGLNPYSCHNTETIHEATMMITSSRKSITTVIGIIFFIMREYMTFADERIHSVKNQRATHMAVSEERENFSNAILHLEQDCLYR